MERSYERLGFQGRSDSRVCRSVRCDERIEERRREGTREEETTSRGAALACRSEGGEEDRTESEAKVRIGENYASLSSPVGQVRLE